MDKDSKIGIAVIVGIALVGGAYLIGKSSNNSQQPSNTPTDVSTQTAPTPQQTAAQTQTDIDLKSKCATDGKVYYQDFYKQFTQVKSVWFDPQFHFNSRLNTCLVYISWNDTSAPTTWNTDYSGYTLIVTNNNIVYDVYSNEAVLQNSTVKTYIRLNGNTQETDALGTYPYAQNIPNSSGDDFSSQLKVLMSE